MKTTVPNPVQAKSSLEKGSSKLSAKFKHSPPFVDKSRELMVFGIKVLHIKATRNDLEKTSVLKLVGRIGGFSSMAGIELTSKSN